MVKFTNTLIQEIIAENEIRITSLQEQFENAIPKLIVADINPERKAEIAAVMWKLAKWFTLYQYGYDPTTGNLDISEQWLLYNGIFSLVNKTKRMENLFL